MKICQKCSQENDDNNQFCIGCGSAFETKTTKNLNTDEVILQVKAQHYWKWLLNSWKNPSKVQDNARWYGIITLTIEAIFFAIGVGHYVNLSGSYASNALSSLGAAFGQSNSAATNIMGIGHYLTLIVVCVLAALAMIGVTFIFYNNVSLTKVKFIPFTNQIVHYSGSLVLVNFVFMLFAYLCTNITSVALGVSFLLLLMVIIWNLAFLTSLMAVKDQGRFDGIYAALIVYIINTIIYWISFGIESQQIGSIIKEIIPF